MKKLRPCLGPENAFSQKVQSNFHDDLDCTGVLKTKAKFASAFNTTCHLVFKTGPLVFKNSLEKNRLS